MAATHRVQMTNVTSVWKVRATTADVIEVGDGLYARGVEMPDGTVAADAVWVNIVNLDTHDPRHREEPAAPRPRRKAAAPVVRSALLDHWEDDGWRILQYSGVYGDRENARPVAVVFALDATAGRDTGDDPIVRVSYVDADSGEAVAVDELRAAPSRRILPMAG